MDWRTSPAEDTIFYMINSQECSVVKFTDTNSYTALNVIWGLVFLILGVCKFNFLTEDFLMVLHFARRCFDEWSHFD